MDTLCFIHKLKSISLEKLMLLSNYYYAQIQQTSNSEVNGEQAFIYYSLIRQRIHELVNESSIGESYFTVC